MGHPFHGGASAEAGAAVSPRGKRKLAAPEAFTMTLELGQFPITVEEKKGRPGYVVMRCFRAGKQTLKAIGRMAVRDDRGAVLPEAVSVAKDKATAWYRQLTGAEPTAAKAPALFTIGDTWAAISDPETGKYPHRSGFRDELQRALEYAGIIWGTATAWTAITSDSWTRLIRRRLTEQVKQNRTGLRSTEITVSRLLTAANWLRKKKRIPLEAAIIDSEWRDEMEAFWMGLTKQKSVPDPHRPRHTDAEVRAILEKSWARDPRFGFMMALGAELRLGQVARAKRSDLDMDANTFTVRGSGDKKGETIELTDGQQSAAERALDGYLRKAEALYEGTPETDYYLFPAAYLSGVNTREPFMSVKLARASHVAENTIRHWYRDTETMAGVRHIQGRGAYGVRRRAVDSALEQDISEHGLKSLGGWSSGDMPRKVYADKANKAGRSEAAKVRAAFRGEA